MVATEETTSPATIVRRQPSIRRGTARLTSDPPAINAATPMTLNWYPTSRTARGAASGAAAPIARRAHGEVGRWRSRDAPRAASIAAERTAASGAPINATYTPTTTIAAIVAVRRAR